MKYGYPFLSGSNGIVGALKKCCYSMASGLPGNKIILVAAGLFLSAMLHAQSTYTWIGATGSWAISTNWNPTRSTQLPMILLCLTVGHFRDIYRLPVYLRRQ